MANDQVCKPGLRSVSVLVITRGEILVMRIRQIVFVVSVVLTISSQAAANISPSVQGIAHPYFAGQSLSISTPASWANFVYFEDFTGLETITPARTENPASYWPVAERYEKLVIGETRRTPSIMLVGMFSGDGANLYFQQFSSLRFGISDMTRLLIQQGFVASVGLKNIVASSGANRAFLGINEARQWSSNIGDFNLTGSPVPAPIAIVIGSIGVGFIGWMRVYKTYTV